MSHIAASPTEQNHALETASYYVIHICVAAMVA